MAPKYTSSHSYGLRSTEDQFTSMAGRMKLRRLAEIFAKIFTLAFAFKITLLQEHNLHMVWGERTF
jgi:hypothetical protein